MHSVFLRSDGRAVVVGEIDLPVLEDGITFACNTLHPPPLALQVLCVYAGDEQVRVTCSNLSGAELCAVTIHENQSISRVSHEIVVNTKIGAQRLELVLPNHVKLHDLSRSTKLFQL
eukprot:gnl/MRDRNA2_/MRDRNA2_595967_c0_seq1.p1 gnl/MRDRNA2_/MRDRNA2_595967_c0~~gnl/MRDRNA2_/MRDRNA2_595967_c0_seq1.p1  ORF type:complete len:124 (+),score=16.86 gnl/MRDRNA2_/MRDRNA2_595967_c0_seq1:24-374(+)